MSSERVRTIATSERSGVLAPENLSRFAAVWIRPAHDVRAVVDTYWTVRWNLPAEESVDQRIIDFPAVTFSIEQGDVPAPFVVSSPHPKAWNRRIVGRGSVFAIRLRPAGLAVLSDLNATVLTPEQALTTQLDARAYAFVRAVSGTNDEDRAERADALIREMIRERPPTPTHLLANAALDALISAPQVRRGRDIATVLGTSERTLQRALQRTVGRRPNDVARRIRLQEVVRRLSDPGSEIARIATELGYVDQAHLTNEFRVVTNTTPGQYLRDQRRSPAPAQERRSTTAESAAITRQPTPACVALAGPGTSEVDRMLTT